VLAGTASRSTRAHILSSSPFRFVSFRFSLVYLLAVKVPAALQTLELTLSVTHEID
jgi:hypothetical protein